MADKLFKIAPDLQNTFLTKSVNGIDHEGNVVNKEVVVERPLTIFLNNQEIITVMTIGDHPKFMAVGFLINQNMLLPSDKIIAVDVDWESEVVVVRTDKPVDYQKKLIKKTRTSGCAMGTVFGDIMEKFDSIILEKSITISNTDIYNLLNTINRQPSLYLKSGAIHGCVLNNLNNPEVYFEDVGRHNAVDKIAGYIRLNNINSSKMSLYTTGRLTSEMVIKTVQMKIPILISRSGFTAWGVELAKKANLSLIGRAKGKRFVILSAPERIIFDSSSEDE